VTAKKRERVEERFEVRNPDHRATWLARIEYGPNDDSEWSRKYGHHLYRKDED
jgi:hypothetical protein